MLAMQLATSCKFCLGIPSVPPGLHGSAIVSDPRAKGLVPRLGLLAVDVTVTQLQPTDNTHRCQMI